MIDTLKVHKLESEHVTDGGLNPWTLNVFKKSGMGNMEKWEVSISVRTYFSLLHIQAAAEFSRQAELLENQEHADLSQAITKLHSYAVGAVISSAAFLEALVNEVYADAGEKFAEFALPAALKAKLAVAWPNVGRSRTLEKSELALVLAESNSMRGSDVFQEAEYVIELRNYLVHAKPTWIPGGVSKGVPPRIQSFMSKLQERFPLNPFQTGQEPLFPNKMLGSGCARWALRSVIRFTDELLTRLGGRTHYEHIRAVLGVMDQQ